MKNIVKKITVFLMMPLLVSMGACVNITGPSDEEIIQAINDTGLFSGGLEKFTLKSPIEIIDRGSRNSDGSWPVKVKMVVSYVMADGRESKPKQRTSEFLIYKSKDSSGEVAWTAR